ncbi:ABC transporter ATP-binding protein/permease [Salipaludibacillus sp. LMS25]|jgi:ATP-binding cassette subfamily B protein|uniref:ABC transporter ATP-binding protein n=1 Tax=Salipaludibacillus sp. LMS25 TaxID=2924031 RepID=UPI0020D0402E|nr:ABC transporter ATP-binding protein [Salipaludibacillus sp. LMS25]UTR16548.1 ABC transporter ATP-binding protein/permease [Salipaludibacillus sp. LMS25]
MKAYFKNTFALSDKGASDVVKAVLWTALCNILLISSSILLYWFLRDSLLPVLENKTPIFAIGTYVAFSITLILLIFICYYFQYNATFLSAYQESSTKRISLAETLRRLPLSFFGKKDLTDLTTTIMSDTASMETAFSHFIPKLYGAAISTILLSIGMLCFNFKMGLSVLWVVPVSFLLCYATKKSQDKFGRKSKDAQLSYLEKMQECIENIKDIKFNNRKETHIDVMERSLSQYENDSVKGELVTGILVTSAQMILKVGIATTMLTGIYLLVNNDIDILTFLVFLMIATRIFEPLSESLINLAAVFISLLSVERMKELENTKIQQGKEKIVNQGFDIVFHDVEFEYNQNESVLMGVSFIAKQGEITALVGPSGGGKSTVLKLAARFWDINSGKITIGGEDISKVDPETLLKEISIVFQDVTLFNNTVLENIRIGKKDSTEEEVILAAKAAKCHDFIMEMPNGYNTLIGENGSYLSGGERQRLSIARALLKDAPIVLLDEATSSLDIQNETAVQQAISRLTHNKTVIVVAHRMRTIANADKIVLLKEGKVHQIGNHKELISHQGDYANMIALQAQSANWKLV